MLQDSSVFNLWWSPKCFLNTNTHRISATGWTDDNLLVWSMWLFMYKVVKEELTDSGRVLEDDWVPFPALKIHSCSYPYAKCPCPFSSGKNFQIIKNSGFRAYFTCFKIKNTGIFFMLFAQSQLIPCWWIWLGPTLPSESQPLMTVTKISVKNTQIKKTSKIYSLRTWTSNKTNTC